MKTNKAFASMELLIVIAIGTILGAVALGAIGGCTKSDGARVGVVTKFSYKGMTLATKSFEGELTMMGVGGSANIGIIANVWKFSIMDKSVAAKVDKLQDSGHRSKLLYRQSLMHNPFRRDTNYTVYDAIDLETNSVPVKIEK